MCNVWWKNRRRKKSVKFLLKLGIGWIVGFIAAVLILTSVFESHIYQVSSLFIGFIVFSIPLIVYEEKESLKKFYNVIFLLLGVALVAVITMANPSDGGMVSDGSVNFVQLLYIAFVGMIAISAMVQWYSIYMISTVDVYAILIASFNKKIFR